MMQKLLRKLINSIQCLLDYLGQRINRFITDASHPLNKGSQQMEHFTNRARLCLKLAQEFAESLKHTTIGVEHILMGLLRVDGSIARHILLSLNLNEAELEQQIQPLYLVNTDDNTTMESSELNEDVKQVLVLAVATARQMRNPSIGTEHLLIGLMQLNNPQITQILKIFNTDAQTIIAATESLMQEQPDEKDKP
jgi:ATP-dependent Clp protease ATP-binding subunit ClpC